MTTLREDYSGALNTALKNAEQAGFTFIADGDRNSVYEWRSGSSYAIGDVVYTKPGDTKVPDADEGKYWKCVVANNDADFTKVNLTPDPDVVQWTEQVSKRATVSNDLKVQAGKGNKEFTLSYTLSGITLISASDLRSKGPLWQAFVSGVSRALYVEDLMTNEFTISLNTSNTDSISLEIAFKL